MTNILSFISKIKTSFFVSSKESRYCSSADTTSLHDVLVEIDGKKVSKVRLLGISKLGHLSWIGCLDNRIIKIYQTFSSAHAEFVEIVSRDAVLGRYFPKVLYRKKEYLIVEWISGTPCNKRKTLADKNFLRKLVELQVILHTQIRIPEASSFDYLTWLQERIRRYLGPFRPNETICQMLDIVQQYTPSEVINHVSHPDVTPANVVIEKTTGELKVIDNELLGDNWYYLIDLFNTLTSLGGSEDVANQYITLYHALGGDLIPLIEHTNFFLAAWSIRLIGAALQAEGISRAFDLAKQLNLDSLMTHPILKVAKRCLNCL